MLSRLLFAMLAAAISFAPARPSDLHHDEKQPRIRLIPIDSGKNLRLIQETPDGTRLLTHNAESTVKIWDPRSMRILGSINHAGDDISDAKFSLKGDLLVAVSRHRVTLWTSNTLHLVVDLNVESDRYLSKVAFSDDGSYLAVADLDGNLAVISTEPQSHVVPKWISVATAKVNDCQFSPDGKMLVVGSLDETSSVWSVPNLTKVSSLSKKQGSAQFVSVSPDSEQALITLGSGSAALYHLPDGEQIISLDHQVAERSGGNTRMAAEFVGPHHEWILTATSDGVMHLRDRKTLKGVRDLEGHKRAIRELRVSRDGIRAGTYADDGQLKLWDIAAGAEHPYESPDSTPMAGEFGPTGDIFWVGYQDGSIRRHEFSSGKVRSTTTSSVSSIRRVQFVGDGASLLVYKMVWGSSGRAELEPYWFRPSGQSVTADLPSSEMPIVVSPDGRRGFIAGGETATSYVVDFDQNRTREFNSLSINRAMFSADSKAAILQYNSKNVVVVNADDLSDLSKTLTFEAEVNMISLSPTAKFMAVVNNSGILRVYDRESGKVLLTKAGVESFLNVQLWSADETKFVIPQSGSCLVWDTRDWKQIVLPYEVKQVNSGGFAISGDSKYLIANSDGMQVWDLASGKTMYKAEEAWHASFGLSVPTHPTQPWVITKTPSGLKVINYLSGAEIYKVGLKSELKDARFLNASRLVSLDAQDSLTFFEVNPVSNSFQRLGNWFAGREGDWLATDIDGRYDAPDPAKFDGASYVFEYDKGLVPISINQLKSQFYEPDLYKKLAGLSTESVRPVPDLSSLRLFPSVKITPEAKSTGYEIAVDERDEGGIGAVSISLNGKEVMKKEGSGFLRFDPKEFSSYLLPESELEGHGNILSVQASNESGTLRGDPEVVDIGVPKDLQVPQVKMHVLCVGVGDYAGNTKDLKAPPSDATAVAEAITSVSERLLPQKVDVTTLCDSKEDGKRPTKVNIHAWFDHLSKTATSSDIVMVFFAGHGTSSIGSKQDYFFLTAEADPAELTPASAETGAISGAELKKWLGAVPANKQVLILDTCHSGAAASEIVASRSVSGDYKRAYEGIKDATGTWLLAGTAADQLSYESSNVDHGMLTFSLLEALDQVNATALKAGDQKYFVDVERWLSYAARRVESLKEEVGIAGIQRPELRHTSQRASFDLGVLTDKDRGFIGLKPPRPIVIVGPFEKDQEDPAGLEVVLKAQMPESLEFKPWFEVQKQPNAYRIAGTYDLAGDAIKVKVVFQKFDSSANRKTLDTFEVSGKASDLASLAKFIRDEIDKRIRDRSKGTL